jgi:thioredoxin-like negative regulator of GroEL
MQAYSVEEMSAFYELGRTYFEMGYFAPAERIFNGLAALDDQQGHARLALGMIKLERGLLEEATTHFRAVLEQGNFELAAKLGLCACFVSSSDVQRAQSILSEIAGIIEKQRGIDPEIRKLYEAFVLRVRRS